MALLRAAFPNTRIDAESTVNLWYGLYSQEDFEVAKKATELVIRTSDFFPSHKEFGKALFSCRSSGQGQPKLPELSEDSIQKKIDAIMEIWKDSE